jgi:hypothetical protein
MAAAWPEMRRRLAYSGDEMLRTIWRRDHNRRIRREVGSLANSRR